MQGSFKPLPTDTLTTWWHRGVQLVADEIRALVRVSRVDNPDAALLSPEQTFFLRENLKLRLLNARLAVLSRQLETARGDMLAASAALGKYFEANARKTVLATGLMKQIQGQMQTLELPRVDDTLSALEVAAAGR